MRFAEPASLSSFSDNVYRLSTVLQPLPILAPSATVSVANQLLDAELSLSSPLFHSLNACSLSYCEGDRSDQ